MNLSWTYLAGLNVQATTPVYTICGDSHQGLSYVSKYLAYDPRTRERGGTVPSSNLSWAYLIGLNVQSTAQDQKDVYHPQLFFFVKITLGMLGSDIIKCLTASFS